MDALDSHIMQETSNVQKDAAKTERQIAAMYAQISSAHRLRAIGMETGDEKHFALSEQYFDNAEQIGREAFDVVSFNVKDFLECGRLGPSLLCGCMLSTICSMTLRVIASQSATR